MRSSGHNKVKQGAELSCRPCAGSGTLPPTGDVNMAIAMTVLVSCALIKVVSTVAAVTCATKRANDANVA